MSDSSYNRRDFVRQGVKGLAGLLGNLRGDEAPYQKVEAGDIRIMSAMADYPGGDQRIPAFIARPDPPGVYPAVIVLHENTGLGDHIKEVAIRLAREGFVAIAPDLFFRAKPPADRDGHQGMPVHTIPDASILSDLEATVEHLDVLTFVDAKRLGVIGFGMGGLYAYLFAAKTTRLAAAVDFYGPVAPERSPQKPEAPIDVVPRVNCPILGIFGGSDPEIPVAEVHALRDTMISYRKSFEIKIYPNAPSAFFNETSASYRADMAQDAWNRALSFFWKYLRGTQT